MATNWSGRVVPITNWGKTRIWWAYLKNNAWKYILTKSWKKIIVKVKWWELSMTNWNTRPII